MIDESLEQIAKAIYDATLFDPEGSRTGGPGCPLIQAGIRPVPCTRRAAATGIRWLENGRQALPVRVRRRSGTLGDGSRTRSGRGCAAGAGRARRRRSPSSSRRGYRRTRPTSSPERSRRSADRLAHGARHLRDVPLADLQRQVLEIAAWRATLPERLRYPATSALDRRSARLLPGS